MANYYFNMYRYIQNNFEYHEKGQYFLSLISESETHKLYIYSLHIHMRSRKALEKQYLFRGSLCFLLVFLVSTKRLYDIHVT